MWKHFHYLFNLCAHQTFTFVTFAFLRNRMIIIYLKKTNLDIQVVGRYGHFYYIKIIWLPGKKYYATQYRTIHSLLDLESKIWTVLWLGFPSNRPIKYVLLWPPGSVSIVFLITAKSFLFFLHPISTLSVSNRKWFCN